MKARVLYVNYEKKAVGLSLLPSVIAFSPVSFRSVEARPFDFLHPCSVVVCVFLVMVERMEGSANDENQMLTTHSMILL